MDESITYYADGSAVSVGDIVEFDKESALDSYCGYVREMDDLVGYKLKVISAYGVKPYHGSYVATMSLEPVGNPEDCVWETISGWNYSSDMFVKTVEANFDTVNIDAFLEEV